MGDLVLTTLLTYGIGAALTALMFVVMLSFLRRMGTEASREVASLLHEVMPSHVFWWPWYMVAYPILHRRELFGSW